MSVFPFLSPPPLPLAPYLPLPLFPSLSVVNWQPSLVLTLLLQDRLITQISPLPPTLVHTQKQRVDLNVCQLMAVQ